MKPITTAALAALLTLSSASGAPPQAASAQQTAPYTYVGTVQELEPQGRTLSMLTGVGLAFRVVQMRVSSTATIATRGAALSLGDLKPGDVIRAVCRMVDGHLVADRIDRLPPTGDSPGQAP